MLNNANSVNFTLFSKMSENKFSIVAKKNQRFFISNLAL